MRKKKEWAALFLVLAVCAAVAALWAGSAMAAEGSPEAAPVVEHRVVKGDNLSLLAGYYYKDPRQWRKIYSLNSGMLKEPGMLVPGTVLRVRTEPGRQWQIPYEEFVALVYR